MKDFESFFVTEYPRLVRALNSAGLEVEEDVQEAFIAAYRRWHRISVLDDPAGWVRRVAINRISNTRRSRRRERAARVRLEAMAPPPASHNDPESSVLAAVALLGRQQRIVVALFYGAGYPISDIATAMNISDGTVKSQLHDARNRLRKLIREQEEVSDGRE